MASPKPGRVDWWWCDSLYMAPPVHVRLHAATGEKKYLDYLNTMYWDTYDFLYDKQERLFFRDKKYFDAKAKNGEKGILVAGQRMGAGGFGAAAEIPSGGRSRPREI